MLTMYIVIFVTQVSIKKQDWLPKWCYYWTLTSISYFLGCMGFHLGRFDLVCHPFLLGHHHGPGLPGHEQCPGGAPPDRRRRLFWASGPPGGPKTPGYHWWICHAFPDFDGSHVNWVSWGHCCGFHHNLWYLPGTISRDFSMSVWTQRVTTHEGPWVIGQFIQVFYGCSLLG